MASIKQQHAAAPGYASDENIAKNLRKFCSAHTSLLSWVGFQALQLKRVPSNIRQQVLVIDLAPHNFPEGHRRSVSFFRYVLRMAYPTLQILGRFDADREAKLY